MNIRRFLSIVLLTVLSFQLYANDNALWLRYPSISPNGEQIVFAYQGDLYKVDANGENAVQLTQHKAYDYKPVWTPDGKYIVFSSKRYGSFDLFKIPAEGGMPERLTFYSGNEVVTSITEDNKVLFTAYIEDAPKNIQFPSGALTELYQVDLNGGRIERILSTPAELAQFNKSKSVLLYQDKKGYEDPWRKHHTSSVTRDVWKYDVATGKHTKLSPYNGEDRNPIWAPNEEDYYYLSEQFGSFNVCKANINAPSDVKQISKFETHPVRFLSIANNGLMCYSYDGELYTQEEGKEPKKLNIAIKADNKWNPTQFKTLRSGAGEMAVSPNGKEVAFIVRGEVYVTSTEYNTTKRITNTPEQERSVSFSPDGKKILYASERDGSWNLYESKIVREGEKYFSNATIIKEEPVLVTKPETFQAKYSPDGKEIAFLEERTTLRVLNLATKKVRTVLEGTYNYSYSDGDQWYDWSPDSKWFLVEYLPTKRWVGEIGLVKADGSQEAINLSESGYSDSRPKWMMKGEALIWFSDKQGYRSHGSWGAESDVYAMFLTQDAYDKFTMSKEEYELQKELKKEEKKDADKDKDKKKKKKDKKKIDEDDKDKVKPIKIELDNIRDRVIRLTINSSNLGDAILTPKGDKLYYFSKFEKGYDLWMKDIRKNQTKLVHKMRGYGGGFQFDKDAKNLYFVSGGQLMKMAIAGNKKKSISYKAEFNLNPQGEREYMFEHAWRQVQKKFYDPNIHGLDWEMLKKEYAKFLPHINNNIDFTEMLSELLGELNASHTGASYRTSLKGRDRTASLGAFLDWSYKGKGIKIAEVLEGGPFTKAKSKVKAGDIIESINGQEIPANGDFYALLNHLTGKKTLLNIYRPSDNKRWEEVIKPIGGWEESNLLYKRWVKWMNKETERLSNGRIGYVHVKGMNSASFREVFSDLLGKHADKEAVVVDTRFNGGGWLHDDLATLLSGKEYAKFSPRGEYVGSEPMNKWYRPSVVLMGEGNYSDAHGFPYTYNALKIGKLVGMPVPGTMTAVWWERMITPGVVFGIPQLGVKDMNGNYLENQELQPDIKVAQDKDVVVEGRDQQLEAAVEELLKQIDK